MESVPSALAIPPVQRAEPVISCDTLVKIYKVADLEVVALQGLDLEVARGEIMALVGASGSGKTTLLNILGGLDLPSAGKCVVAGYDLTRLSEAQRLNYRRFVVGHIWQQSGRNLLSELTALGNIEEPLLLSGVGLGRRRRKAHELLEMVGLAEAAKKRPEQLSGGEQQRVAIAVAIANDPQVLLSWPRRGALCRRSHRAVAGRDGEEQGWRHITLAEPPSSRFSPGVAMDADRPLEAL